MTTTNLPAAPDEITRLVAERVQLEHEIAPLQARLDEINKRLRNDVEPGKWAAGAFDLVVSTSKRFDKKAFEKAFPAANHPEFYETREVTELVKDRISKAVQDQYTTAYDNRVTIR